MQRPVARWINFTTRSAMMIGVAALAACSQESAPPAAEETPVAIEAGPTLAPPGEAEFKAAWSDACHSAEPVSTALCKSKGLTDPGFECDFGLGEDEYRRHAADLTRGQDRWELANAEQACKIGSEEG